MEQNKFYQIKNITEHEYTLVGCDGSVITRPIQDVDRLASAFTIQDAKAGDVLASLDKSDILIFRNLDTSQTFSSYYNIPGKGNFYWLNDCFIPATKEQRDLLFRKMKEAGYEWDEEKLELKKIAKVNCTTTREWKPSDEQIKAIRLARSFVTDDFSEHPTLSESLMELEEQLRNLKRTE